MDEDTPPLTQHEAEELARSETYSITSEDSYNDRKTVRRKTSGSSRDSGAFSLGKLGCVRWCRVLTKIVVTSCPVTLAVVLYPDLTLGV